MATLIGAYDKACAILQRNLIEALHMEVCA